MNNKEYMEYEGYRVIEAALLSYTSPAGNAIKLREKRAKYVF